MKMYWLCFADRTQIKPGLGFCLIKTFIAFINLPEEKKNINCVHLEIKHWR